MVEMILNHIHANGDNRANLAKNRVDGTRFKGRAAEAKKTLDFEN